jgi:hypothetical protein
LATTEPLAAPEASLVTATAAGLLPEGSKAVQGCQVPPGVGQEGWPLSTTQSYIRVPAQWMGKEQFWPLVVVRSRPAVVVAAATGAAAQHIFAGCLLAHHSGASQQQASGGSHGCMGCPRAP